MLVGVFVLVDFLFVLCFWLIFNLDDLSLMIVCCVVGLRLADLIDLMIGLI